MGEIFVEGLGIVELEGDVPNERETEMLLKTIGDPNDEGDPFITQREEPPIPSPRRIPGVARPQRVGEGPIGIVSPEQRGSVRGRAEAQSGLMQLITDMFPSTAGGAVGATGGGMVAGPPGALIGGIGGAVVGELIGQETGVVPRSDINLGLAAGGPLAGRLVGGGYRLGKRGVGAAISSLPPAKVARARNIMGQAVESFETIGGNILAKQKGLLARPASDLYKAAGKAGIKVGPHLTANTRAAMDELIKKLKPIEHLPNAKAAIEALRGVDITILQKPGGARIEDLVETRTYVGAILGSLGGDMGRLKKNAARKIFKAISDDLDNIADSPFAKGRSARLAKAAAQRAKLDFAVKDLEAAVATFSRVDPQAKMRVTNFKQLQKWLDDVTNPKLARTGKYDKNFTSALKDELPEIKERVARLAEITSSSSAAGPGGLVLRGTSARVGRAVGAGVGAIIGFGTTGGSLIGAGAGGVLGAQFPEMLVAILTTKPGAAFLEKAAQMGKGQISQRAWQVAGTIALRSMGEEHEETVDTSRERGPVPGTPPSIEHGNRRDAVRRPVLQ